MSKSEEILEELKEKLKVANMNGLTVTLTDELLTQLDDAIRNDMTSGQVDRYKTIYDLKAYLKHLIRTNNDLVNNLIKKVKPAGGLVTMTCGLCGATIVGGAKGDISTFNRYHHIQKLCQKTERVNLERLAEYIESNRRTGEKTYERIQRLIDEIIEIDEKEWREADGDDQK